MAKRIVFGSHDDNTIEQFNALLRDNDYLGLMADGHLGYGVPIGCVMVNEDKISPQGVGYDIGCGNTAYKLDLKVNDVDLDKLEHELSRVIPFGVGNKDCLLDKINLNNSIFSNDLYKKYNAKYADYEETTLSKLWNILDVFLDSSAVNDLRDKAKKQIGSVGSGNHYLDIFSDNDDYLWVGVHFGSRGLGHKIATMFMNALGCENGMMASVKYLNKKDLLFNPYVDCISIVQTYASFGRNMVCDVVVDLLGAPSILEKIENHHNAMWLENHFGKECYVVRKGSTPNENGQKSFVGATMLQNSYILEGSEKSTSESCLTSTVHGAGRVMGRMKAKGKKKNGVWVVEPLIDRNKMVEDIKNSGIRVIGGDVDEFVDCYKNLDDVLKCQKDTINIVNALKPLMVFMAGNDVVDPYKD